MLVKIVTESGGDLTVKSTEPLILGRGNETGVNDKRVSRKHASVMYGPNGEVTLTPLHINPCFRMAGGLPPVQVVKKGDKVVLENGDLIGLIPNVHWLKVVIDVSITDSPSSPSRLVSPLKQEESPVPVLTPSRATESAFTTNTDSDRELLQAAADYDADSTITTAESLSALRRPATPPTPDLIVPQNDKLAFSAHLVVPWDLPKHPENGVSSPKSELLGSTNFSSRLEPSTVSTSVVSSVTSSPVSPSMVTEPTAESGTSSLSPIVCAPKIRRLPDWMLNDSGPSPKKSALEDTGLENFCTTPKRCPVEEPPTASVPPPSVNPLPPLTSILNGSTDILPVVDNISIQDKPPEIKREPETKDSSTCTENQDTGASSSEPQLLETVQVKQEPNQPTASAPPAAPVPILVPPGPARRPLCQYEQSCYRRNQQHKADFSHPSDADWLPPNVRPVCPFDPNCYRRSQAHRVNMRHTDAPPSRPVRATRSPSPDDAYGSSTDGESSYGPDPYETDDDGDAEYVPPSDLEE